VERFEDVLFTQELQTGHRGIFKRAIVHHSHTSLFFWDVESFLNILRGEFDSVQET
jgi:hypothetical protein